MDKFCTRLKPFKIQYIKKETSIEEVKDAVKKKLNGPSERFGYRAMNQKLRMEHGIKVPSNLVCAVMQELDDEGLNRREPIMKKHSKKEILLLKELTGPIL